MLYLQVTGKLNQYINTHYQYLAILSMMIALVLAIVQLVKWVRGGGLSMYADENEAKEKKKHHHEEDSHGLTPFQKVTSIILLTIPLAVGFLFPTVSLDATIVDAKGFNFPLSKDSQGTTDMQQQYLKPNTKIFFNDSDYTKMMTKIKKKYVDKDVLKITDKNYLEVMETIYDYPGEFARKKINYTGFIYQAPEEKNQTMFVFRFGILHCVADSGVYGLLVNMPEGQSFKNNDWVNITGTLEMQTYQPMKRTLPSINVSSVNKISAPKNQYVYRIFQ
jgi:putative membrane protein